jgi:membrane protease YdiL (CAAX protease family)
VSKREWDEEDEEEEEEEEEDSSSEETSETGEEGPPSEEVLGAKEREELQARLIEEERGYFSVTQSRSASLIFILPLLIIYEIGVIVYRADINGVAAIVKSPITYLRQNPIEMIGAGGMILVTALLIGLVAGAIWHIGRLGALRLRIFAGMLAESAVYALLLGPFALMPVTGQVQWGGFEPQMSNFMEKVVIATGAGLYEEFLFRFIILGLLYYLLKELTELSTAWAAIWSLLLSSALFSGLHLIGPESMSFGAFNYRLSAGFLLGLIFLWRGLGIAAWTHTLYDVYVLCFSEGGGAA